MHATPPDAPPPAYTLFNAGSGHVIAVADTENVARRIVRDHVRTFGTTPGLTVEANTPTGATSTLDGPALYAWAAGENSWRLLLAAKETPD